MASTRRVKRMFGISRRAVRARWRYDALCRAYLPYTEDSAVPYVLVRAIERTSTFRRHILADYGIPSVHELTRGLSWDEEEERTRRVLSVPELVQAVKSRNPDKPFTTDITTLTDSVTYGDLNDDGSETFAGYWRRHCVNYLRHNRTEYESSVMSLSFAGQQEYRAVTLHLLRLTALRYVAETYGWLRTTAQRYRDNLEVPVVYGNLAELIRKEGTF